MTYRFGASVYRTYMKSRGTAAYLMTAFETDHMTR